MNKTRRDVFKGVGAGAVGAAMLGASAAMPLPALAATTSKIYALNVTDFGADWTGTSDSTVAFENAINAAAQSAAAGGVIYIPSGLYKISRTLVVPNYVSLVGPGTPHSTTLDFTSQTLGPAIQVTGYGHVGLEGFCIMNPAGHGVSISESTPGALYKNVCHVRDVLVIGARNGGSGFAASNTYLTSFERCWARYCEGNGFYMSGFHTSLRLETCWADNCSGNGFHLNATVYSQLSNCGADNSGGYGYLMTNCQGVSLVSCGAEATKYSSVCLVASAAWASTSKEAEDFLSGISIISFYSLGGNSGNHSGWPSYLNLYSEDNKKIKGSSMNHHSRNGGGHPEIIRGGYNPGVNIDFLSS